MEESSNVKKVESGKKQFSMPEMVKNVGSTDKNIRLGAGGALVLVGVFGSKLWLILGIYLLATVWFGICPVYAFLKHKTL
ncbi:hypothetical protein AB833_22725 [Chromatiales bacterium (ex Bugula neritina AB1)]|nr:hypothetical protein AB833_22725 [Chromatiales bacterium (ex Bugula neritina AB1)]